MTIVRQNCGYCLSTITRIDLEQQKSQNFKFLSSNLLMKLSELAPSIVQTLSNRSSRNWLHGPDLIQMIQELVPKKIGKRWVGWSVELISYLTHQSCINYGSYSHFILWVPNQFLCSSWDLHTPIYCLRGSWQSEINFFCFFFFLNTGDSSWHKSRPLTLNILL